MDTCNVCIEKYNKKNRFKINCFNCNFNVCRSCVKTYILTTNSENIGCMNCHILWNDKFIYDNLTQSFFNKEYKEHLSNIFFKNKYALRQKLQPRVELIIKKNNFLIQRDITSVTKKSLRKKINTELFDKIYFNFIQPQVKDVETKLLQKRLDFFIIEQYKNKKLPKENRKKLYELRLLSLIPYKKYIEELKQLDNSVIILETYKDIYEVFEENNPEIKNATICYDYFNLTRLDYKRNELLFRDKTIRRSSFTDIVKKYSIDYIIKQINDDYYINELKTNYQLYEEQINKLKELDYLLDTLVIDKNTYSYPCSNNNCNGLLKDNKWDCDICNKTTCSKCFDIILNENHKCCPDKIKTAKLLMKDTKKCPKCNYGITKIDGCDVMFCTNCKTSFNWQTLKILTKNLHNPHYIEYLRQNPNANRDRINLNLQCVINPEITDFDTNRFISIEKFCRKIRIFNEFESIASTGINIIQFILHVGWIIENIDRILTDINNNIENKIISHILDNIEIEKVIKKETFNVRFLNERKNITQTLFDAMTDMIFHYSNNELMALNNTILNLTDTYTYSKLCLKPKSFFDNYFTESNFIEMRDKIITTNNMIKTLTEYCIEQDYIICKTYNRRVKLDIKRGLTL